MVGISDASVVRGCWMMLYAGPIFDDRVPIWGEKVLFFFIL